MKLKIKAMNRLMLDV